MINLAEDRPTVVEADAVLAWLAASTGAHRLQVTLVYEGIDIPDLAP